MNRDTALKTLGLTHDAHKDDISAAYRKLIRKAHPDVGGDTAVAARITEAYAWLQHSAPRTVASPRTSKAAPSDERLVLLVPPGDVFARLCELGQRLGELSYLDPQAGIMQVTFTALNSVPCQLMATVVAGSSPKESQVEFTLEALTNAVPPPIAAVVGHMFGAGQPTEC